MLTLILAAGGLLAWTVIYFTIVRPKLEEFRLTAGIYAKLDAFEGSFIEKLGLRAAGSKVTILGFLTTLVPILGPSLESLNGVNWAALLPTERAATVTAILGVLVAVGPMLMVIVHLFSMSDAARTVPVAVDPAAPTLPAEVATVPSAAA